jgi:hypothetical protein
LQLITLKGHIYRTMRHVWAHDAEALAVPNHPVSTPR